MKTAPLALIGLLTGCHREHVPDDSGEPALVVSWGDLHSHSGLSQDGCEDPDALCLPDATLPGEAFFENAATNGLAFAALTDHAEFVTYRRPADGVELDIWERTKALIAAAEDGPVIPILGYEWTADGVEDDQVGVHRTVLLEDPAACAAFRIPGYEQPDPKEQFPALEDYEPNPAPSIVDSRELADSLGAAATQVGCAPSRVVSYLHHVAEGPPASVDWTNPAFTLDSDTVVEMASEHGSSECAVPDAAGCDWHLQSAIYDAAGAVQNALQLGFALGFTGGTDRHDSDPGRVDIGPGPTGHLYDSDADGVQDAAFVQYTTGTLTGVLAPSPLTRAGIFDAIGARHTFASSRVLTGLSVEAVDADGIPYLPGDDMPPGTYTVHVTVDDPDVSAFSADLLNPSGAALAVGEVSFGAGETWYVRVDTTVDGVAHRAWASPFFVQ